MEVRPKILVPLVVLLTISYAIVLYDPSPQLLNLNPNLWDSMTWISEHAKNKVFMNYWQVGHLISYAGGKNAIDGIMYVNNSEEKAYELHKFWVDGERTSWEYMREHGYDYVYVSRDYILVSPVIVAIGTNGTYLEGYTQNGASYTTPEYLHDSLLTELLSGGKNLECFTEQYRNPDVAIYAPNEECP